MPQISKRDELIEAALKLFSQYGYHRTGIDAILEEAGVAKNTLYNHFSSKEELIIAALQEYDIDFRNQFRRKVEARGKTPKERLLAAFDVGEEWFRGRDYYGCLYIGAVGEFSEADTEIREISIENKSLFRNFFKELAEQIGAKKPGQLADELALLFEGATVVAQVSQKPEAAKTAKRIAKARIEASLS